MHQADESESSGKRQKHAWKKPGGEVIETSYKIPPFEPLVDNDGKKEITFSPLSTDKDHISDQVNWGNLAIHHATEHLHFLSRKIYEKVVESVQVTKEGFSETQDSIDANKQAVKALANTFDIHLKDIQTEHESGQDEIRKDLIHIEHHVRNIKVSETKGQSSTIGPASSAIIHALESKVKPMKEAKSTSLFTESTSDMYGFPLARLYQRRSFIPFETKDKDEVNAHEEALEEISESSQSQDLEIISDSEKESETELESDLEFEEFQEEQKIEEVNFQQDKWQTKTKWNTPPEFFITEKDQKYNSNDLRSWNISYKTPAEIQQMLESMVLQYNCYVTGGKTAEVAFNLIILGLEDALQSFWAEMERIEPGSQRKIKEAVLAYNSEEIAQRDGKHKGDPILDAAGNQIPNAIGSLTWSISDQFIGTSQNQGTLYQLYLGRMKLTDMTQFENYYAQFHHLVFKLDNPMDGSYKKQFVHSLPFWFQRQLVQANPHTQWKGMTMQEIMENSWGWLRNSCLTLIVATCNLMKLQKTTNKLYHSQFRDLCKQRGLDPPYGTYKATKTKYPKHQRYRSKTSLPKARSHGQTSQTHTHHKKAKIGRRLDPPKKKMGRSMERRVRSAPRKKEEVKCFFCKAQGHYASACPKRKARYKHMGTKKVNQHDEEESDHNAYDEETESSAPENCQCFGKCTCINSHEAETIQGLMKGLEDAPTIEDKAAIFRLIKIYAEKEVKNTKNDSSKESKVSVPPLSMSQLWKQFQKPVNAQASSSNPDHLHSTEYNKLCSEIKEIKREIQNLYLLYYEMQKEGLSGMPELERDEEWKDDEDWKAEAAKERKFQGMMINFHDQSQAAEDAMTYVIRIPVKFIKGISSSEKYKMKALIDTGSRLNIIHPSLVPFELRHACKSLNAIVTTNGRTEVEYQVSAKVYLSEELWVEVILVLMKTTYGIILGTPFLSQVFPHSYIQTNSASPTRPPKYAVQFTVEKEKFVFPFISKSSPNILGQVNAMTTHLEDLQIQKSLTESPNQSKEIIQLKLALQAQCNDNPTAFWHIFKHEVRLPYHSEFTSSDIPQRSKAIPMNAIEKDLCHKEIQQLLEKGMISPSHSSWGCFAFYVNKHSEIVRGVPRLVVNFKPLNNSLAYDSYPIPKGAVILSQLSQAYIFSKFDCKSGFYQISIHPEDRHKTGFTVPMGHFEWNVMPFGLKNAPSAFQRCMDENFKGMDKFLKVYIDDILIFSATIGDHLQHVKSFLKRCRSRGVVLSSKKMVLFQREITFLGHKISHGNISIMDHSLEFVDKFPDQLKDKVQLQRFLGCLNYVSGFYEKCAIDRKILNQLLKKDAGAWTLEHTEAVKKIKDKVRNLKSLHPIDEEAPKIVFTDASDEGWGGALCQQIAPNNIQICKFVSGVWDDSKKLKWPAVKKELAAVVISIDKLSDFLMYRPFTVKSDCSALNSLIRKADHKEAVVIRWLMFLSHFDFKVEHIKGNANSLADMLSREYLKKEAECNMVHFLPEDRYLQTDAGLEEPEDPNMVHFC